MLRTADRQWRLQKYMESAKSSLEKFWTAVNAGQKCSAASPILAAIDFEGHMNVRGTTEYGIAWIDRMTAGLTTIGYVVSGHRNKRCAFGDCQQVTPESLPRCVIDSIEALTSGGKREVVLVCYGISNELSHMDNMGLAIETLPVTSLVDVITIAKETLGHAGHGLLGLLEVLDIPHRYIAHHNAGNDAHSTLRALLELLQRQRGNVEGLDEIVHAPVPMQKSLSEKSSRPIDDWEAHVGGSFVAEVEAWRTDNASSVV